MMGRLLAAVAALLLVAVEAHAFTYDHKDTLGPVVDNTQSQAACSPPFSLTHYVSYTSSRYYPDHTLDVFLFLDPGEGDPAEYAIRAQVQVRLAGLGLSQCLFQSCATGQNVRSFADLIQTRTEVVSFPFAAISYAQYVTLAQQAGVPVRANAYAAYGHVQVDLGAAGGSSTVTNMLSIYACGIAGDCGMRSSCSGTHTPVNLYEAEKRLQSLTVLRVPVEVCDNRLDDDGNGAIDEACADPGDGPVPGERPGSPTGQPGPPSPPPGVCPEPGNSTDTESRCALASGALTDTLDLLSLPGGPLPLAFTASYSSVAPTVIGNPVAAPGPLGRGWTHSYLARVRAVAAGALTVSVVTSSGTYRTYRQHGTNSTFVATGRGGLRDRLVRQPSGTLQRQFLDGTRWDFAPGTGYLTQVRDRNGHTLTLTHNSSSQLTRVDDPSGRWLTFTYDPGTGYLVQADDSAGRTVSFTYTGDFLTGIVDAAGGSWSFTYDAVGRMLTKTDPRGETVTYTYDAQGRLASVTDAASVTRQFVYNTTTSTTQVLEPGGAAWTQRWDPRLDLPLQVTDATGRVTTYTYDGVGNRLTVTRAGQTWRYTYDEHGRVLTETDPLLQTTTYTYDPVSNQVATRLAPDGGLTEYTSDAAGNLTTVTDPTGRTTTYGYDSFGRLTTITDPAGQTITLTYNTQHQVSSVTDSTGVALGFTYDAVGRLATVSEAGGATTTYAYDALNRLLSVTDPLTHVTSTAYDGRGNVTNRTDGLSRVTQLAYDARGLLQTVTDPAADVTTYAYDDRKRLTGLTDAESRTTSYTYDDAGRVLTETGPLGDVTTYAYDTRGLLQFTTTPRGHVLERRYDAAGRLTERLGPGGLAETYTYDVNGRLETATGGGVTYTFAYDLAGRVTSVTDSRGYVVSYTYDAAGRRQTLTYPGGQVLTYGYDLAGRLTTLTDGPRALTIGYDTRGRRASLTYPNGTQTTYSYDLASRLTGITHATSGSVTLQSFTYGLDAADSRTSLTTLAQGLGFDYDLANRLTGVLATPASPLPSEAFTYDGVGNRLTGPDPGDSYTYNAGHQLLTGPGATYTYDASGNRATKTDATSTTTYTWDAFERLVEAVVTTASGTTTVTFTYDAFGRRIAKTVVTTPTSGPVVTTTTAYVYDGEDVIWQEDTTDASGSPMTTTTRYVHGPGIDEPLLVETGGQVLAIHADGLGSVTGLSDTSQTLVEERAYTAFGAMRQTGSWPDLAYAYTGREWAPELGLYYYRARYYDPEAGRFLSRDPIGFAAGDVNLYGYVLNDPLNRIDPSGLAVERCSEPDAPFVPETVPAAVGGNLKRCLDACAAGGAAWEAFCRSLPDPRLRAGCWALQFASVNACRGWCFWVFTKD